MTDLACRRVTDLAYRRVTDLACRRVTNLACRRVTDLVCRRVGVAVDSVQGCAVLGEVVTLLHLSPHHQARLLLILRRLPPQTVAR